MKSKVLVFIFIFSLAAVVSAQRPRMEGGRPEWADRVDTNKNGRIEKEEFRVAAEEFFRKRDRNNNGILEESEMPPKPQNGRPPIPPSEVPPFLFLERGEFNLNFEAFSEKSNLRFIVIDANGDRVIDMQEIKMVRPPDREPPQRTTMAQFIGAEMRFGDKIVKNAPFSAETVRLETKRLFDGTLVKAERKGLVYRDGEGRLRQEIPFETLAGFPVVGEDNQPKRLVHIVDVVASKTYSLHADTKTYFNVPFRQDSPVGQKNEPPNAKPESLGKQTIEGVTAEGTRTTIEIPVGQIGNDKPIFVVTEKWFSPELQMVVLSKHTDPFIGEVTFRLVNIKLGEPSPELFKVPTDFRLDQPDKPRRPVMKPMRPN